MRPITSSPMPLRAVAVLIVLATAVLIGCASGGDSQTAVPSATGAKAFAATVLPKERGALPVGIPAIRPSVSGNAPAYSLADARQYILCHPMFRNFMNVQSTVTAGQTCDRQAFTIVLLQFASSEEVSRLLNRGLTGLPANTMLCFSELSGQFAFPGPSGKVVTYQVGFEVFHAQTGNLLMVGGLPGKISGSTPTPLGRGH
jgi:hypothetical protein